MHFFLTFKSLMVTIYTTRSIIIKFYFLLTQTLCSVWSSEKTAIIYRQCITEAVFVTDTPGVYRAVQTESLNIIQYNCLT